MIIHLFFVRFKGDMRFFFANFDAATKDRGGILALFTMSLRGAESHGVVCELGPRRGFQPVSLARSYVRGSFKKTNLGESNLMQMYGNFDGFPPK